MCVVYELYAAKRAVIAINDAGKSPWATVSGDFFNNRAGAPGGASGRRRDGA